MADAPRRLYYVAMTRARETLALACFEGGHPFQDALPARPSALRREPAGLPPCPPSLQYHHVQSSLGDVDLGFAGRRGAHHPTHRAIRALSPGDALETRITDGGRWELLDLSGNTVGRLAASFKPPARHALPVRRRAGRRRAEPRVVGPQVPRHAQM